LGTTWTLVGSYNGAMANLPFLQRLGTTRWVYPRNSCLNYPNLFEKPVVGKDE
jgi:hypothetical protein